VNQVFDKIFGNSFKDYRHGMLNIFAKSHLNSKVYEEVEEEMTELNNDIINQIIKGEGAFSDKKETSKSPNT